MLVQSKQALPLRFCWRVTERLRAQRAEAARRAPEGSRSRGSRGAAPLSVPAFQRSFGRLRRLFNPYGDGSCDGQDCSGGANSLDALLSGSPGSRITGRQDVSWSEIVDWWEHSACAYELSFAERVHFTLEDPQSCVLAGVLSKLILIAIISSTASFLLGTMPLCSLEPVRDADGEWLPGAPAPALRVLETVCICVFTLEYLLRLCTCWPSRVELCELDKVLDMIVDEEPVRFSTPLTRLWNFVTAWSNLVDLVAILPFYVDLLVDESFRGLAVVRAVRLMRIFRVVRVAKYGDAMTAVNRSLVASTQVLWVLVFNLGLGVLVFSALIYNVEGGRWNPKELVYKRWVGKIWEDGAWKEQWQVTPFQSIPSSFWWCFMTVATVGYGDDYPLSVIGKTIAVIAALWGIIMLALPIGVVGNNFGIIFAEMKEEKIAKAEAWRAEESLIKATLSMRDQFEQRSWLIVDVYDDLGSGYAFHDFLGVAYVNLDLPLDMPVARCEQVKLEADHTKSSRAVTGRLTVEYKWRPSKHGEGSPRRPSLRSNDLVDLSNETACEEICGELTVQIVRATGLLRLDWKPGGAMDPYCKVQVFARNPGPCGELTPDIWQTRTVRGSTDPEWGEERRFRFELDEKAQQIYNPAIHGPLDQAAKHYARHGNLFGYLSDAKNAGTTRTMAFSIEADSGDEEDEEEELSKLHDEVFTLRRAIEYLGALPPPSPQRLAAPLSSLGGLRALGVGEPTLPGAVVT